MTYYVRSHSKLTTNNQIFRETHLLRNVREMYFEREGWVQGNNLNVIDINDILEHQKDGFFADPEEDDPEDSVSFKGAINADPIWNDRVGQKIFGRPTNNVFANSMDYDMGAFYPSIKIASNMDPSTLLYKAAFDNSEFISGEFPNRSLNQIYEERDKKGNVRSVDLTGEAVNTFCSKNILTFGYNYLGLPSLDSLYEQVLKEYNSAD